MENDSIWIPRLPFRFHQIDPILSPKQEVRKNSYKGEFFSLNIPKQQSRLSLRWHRTDNANETVFVTLFLDDTPLYSLGASQQGGTLEAIFQFVSPTTDRIIVDELASFFNNGSFRPHGNLTSENFLSYLTPLFPSSCFEPPEYAQSVKNEYIVHFFSCVPNMPHAKDIPINADLNSFLAELQSQQEQFK